MATLTRLPELDAYVHGRCQNIVATSAADESGQTCGKPAAIEVDGVRLCQECAEFMEVL
jgi:hypothetical protein